MVPPNGGMGDGSSGCLLGLVFRRSCALWQPLLKPSSGYVSSVWKPDSSEIGLLNASSPGSLLRNLSGKHAYSSAMMHVQNLILHVSVSGVFCIAPSRVANMEAQ